MVIRDFQQQSPYFHRYFLQQSTFKRGIMSYVKGPPPIPPQRPFSPTAHCSEAVHHANEVFLKPATSKQGDFPSEDCRVFNLEEMKSGLTERLLTFNLEGRIIPNQHILAPGNINVTCLMTETNTLCWHEQEINFTTTSQREALERAWQRSQPDRESHLSTNPAARNIVVKRSNPTNFSKASSRLALPPAPPRIGAERFFGPAIAREDGSTRVDVRGTEPRLHEEVSLIGMVSGPENRPAVSTEWTPRSQGPATRWHLDQKNKIYQYRMPFNLKTAIFGRDDRSDEIIEGPKDVVDTIADFHILIERISDVDYTITLIENGVATVHNSTGTEILDAPSKSCYLAPGATVDLAGNISFLFAPVCPR
jgi:hypothetical protein